MTSRKPETFLLRTTTATFTRALVESVFPEVCFCLEEVKRFFDLCNFTEVYRNELVKIIHFNLMLKKIKLQTK